MKILLVQSCNPKRFAELCRDLPGRYPGARVDLLVAPGGLAPRLEGGKTFCLRDGSGRASLDTLRALRGIGYDLCLMPVDDLGGKRFLRFRLLILLAGPRAVTLINRLGAGRNFGRAGFALNSVWREVFARARDASAALSNRPFLRLLAILARFAPRRAPPRRGERIGVAYFIPSMGLGGAQRQVLALIKGLDRSRFEPRVYLLFPSDAFFEGELLQTGVPATYLFGREGYEGRTNLAVALRLFRLLRRRRAAVLHNYLREYQLDAAVAARLAGLRRIILSIRTPPSPIYPWFTEAERRRDRWAAELADVMAPNSLAAARANADWLGREPRRTVVIRNGLCPETVAASDEEIRACRGSLGLVPADRPVAILGRLSPEKDHETFLHALATARGEVPGVLGLVAGDGPLRPRLEGLARELGIADRVRFLGHRRDPYVLMCCCEAVALTSVVEGLPNALIEAALLGRPIVTTAAGGAAEVVENEKSGLVVPPGDAPAFGRALVRLLTEPGLAQGLGESARARARSLFSIERMVAETQALYEEVLSG